MSKRLTFWRLKPGGGLAIPTRRERGVSVKSDGGWTWSPGDAMENDDWRGFGIEYDGVLPPMQQANSFTVQAIKGRGRSHVPAKVFTSRSPSRRWVFLTGALGLHDP